MAYPFFSSEGGRGRRHGKRNTQRNATHRYTQTLLYVKAETEGN